LLNYIIAGCFTFKTNQSFHHHHDLIYAYSFCKLLEIFEERFMNFELGIGIGKNLENGIYEFRE
jgi:hypothetical protein